jgi:para-nitrobenzyl esterase
MMRRFPLLLAMLALAGAGHAAPPDAPVVRVDAGALAGVATDGVESFKGIPFAAPPVGDLRWRAPQPITPWQGVRAANRFSDDCMQEPFPGIAAPLGAPLSENCLYLNVWRPAGAKLGARLPVMVWIHGGGFVNGGASPAVFAGDHFARRGVIMVGIAYRVGRFGFFAHPALTAENKDGGLTGNYGYMDEIAALQWVRRNIAAFGGDPRNVTIFGESAGGMSVQTLMTSPMAMGLFAKAIVQSGGGRSALLGTRYVHRDTPDKPSLEKVGLAFARANGIAGTGPDALARLRTLSPAAVTAGLNMFTSAAQAATYGGPSIDDRLVVAAPDVIYRTRQQARVPVLIGATDGDLSMLRTEDKAAAFAPFGARAEALRRLYDPTGTGDAKSVIFALGGDIAMTEPSRYVARLLAAQGQPVWQFRFSYVADSMRAKTPNGAPHASDVPFVMATPRARYGAATTARDIAMGEAMNTYWANFAKTGDPNGTGLPAWPRYDARADVIMDFAVDGVPAAKPDPRRDRLDLLAASVQDPNAPAGPHQGTAR